MRRPREPIVATFPVLALLNAQDKLLHTQAIRRCLVDASPSYPGSPVAGDQPDFDHVALAGPAEECTHYFQFLLVSDLFRFLK